MDNAQPVGAAMRGGLGAPAQAASDTNQLAHSPLRDVREQPIRRSNMKKIVVFYDSPEPLLDFAGLSATTYDSPAQLAAAEEWNEANPFEYTLGVFQAATGITDRSVALWKLNSMVLRAMTATPGEDR
jgi:hypothetical protein